MTTKQLGKKGSELIKNFEQLVLCGYLPTPNDVPTIGWGSTRIFGRKVKIGEVITEEDAQKQFNLDIVSFVRAVNSRISVPLTQNQFDSLVSLVYNIGETNFGPSTICKLLNAGNYSKAAEQFVRWNKQKGKVLNGITRRRLAEKALFLLEDE